MIPRCDACGAENAATNRYCGQCGTRLQLSAPAIPGERWPTDARSREFAPVEAAANLPPEVIDFDNRIPLIAQDGADRRVSPPPEMLEQVHDHFEREAELHDELRHRSLPHFEVLAEQEIERERLRRNEFLRWHTGNDTAKVSEAAGFAVSNPEEPVAIDAPSFLDFDVVGENASEAAAGEVAHRSFLREGETTSRTGVSGPSFLGLTDDRTPEYYQEEPEPESHLRRNLAFAIVAVATVLIGAQWNSIRSHALKYVQNGSMQAKQPAKAAPVPPPAVAADNRSRDLGTPPADAKASLPKAVENTPNAGPLLPAPSAEKTPDHAPAMSASQTVRIQPPAMSAQVAEPPAKGLVKRKSVSLSRSVMKPRTYRSPKSARRVLPATPTPSLGASEMIRAANASDAEARAAWLWKAVSKGNQQAPVELAKMYERGTGVVQSCDQAQVLLRSAAAKGNEQARTDLQHLRMYGCSGH